LITGASSGVGLEAARCFAAEGARLALLGRSEETLRQVISDHRLDACAIATDVTDRARVDAAVGEAVATLGGLDVVVSNAGAAVFGHVLEVHPDDFDRAVAITFTGAVNVIRAALPHLRASRGTIVATGSLNARVPLPAWSSYAAAKHALRGFLNSLAVEEREQRSGVRIAIVHPGPIDTPLFAQASSATGIQPRVAPESYAAGMVAQALVELAIRPRPEVVLGGETRLLDLMFLLTRARDAGDRPLVSFRRRARRPARIAVGRSAATAEQRRDSRARQSSRPVPSRASPASRAGDAAALPRPRRRGGMAGQEHRGRVARSRHRAAATGRGPVRRPARAA
jgi:NAD(P)-dependent dehydrogenase (short-subunit alcohol dehydrogenase family)